MLHNKLNNYIGLLFVFLFLVSCTQNDKTEEGKTAVIRLLVSSSSSNVNTRSDELSTAEEDAINDIHVLVYNSQGELIGHKYTSYSSSNPAITVETRSSNSNCTIYGIANTGSSTYFDGKAYSEDHLKTLVTEDLSSVDGIKKGTSGSQYFLMSGSLIVPGIDPGISTVSTPLSLSRLAAKIKFKITGNNGITITDYCVKNVPKNSYLAEHTSTDGATSWLSTGVTTLAEGTTSVTDQYFYMYENLKGGRTGTGTPTDQTGKALYAPANSTYIEIHAKSSTFNGLFKIYLGADNTSDYNIKRNNSYTYDIQLLGPGYADTRVTHYGFSLAANNSTQNNSNVYSSGVSNCYIVAPGGTVYIPVIRANQSDLGLQISNITSSTEWDASLLWQTENNLVTVTNPSEARADGCFRVDASAAKSGNAVVAVKNTSGTILWSWHIWVTSYNPDNGGTTNSYNSRTWMDRNLGATSTNIPTSSDISSFGLLYEWGRKDPFPGARSLSIAIGSRLSAYIYNQNGVLLDDETTDTSASGIVDVQAPGNISGNIAYSVAHPTWFIYGTSANNSDWYSNVNGVKNDNLWGGASIITPGIKTIYDPCPAGWRVPSWINSLSPWNGFDATNFAWTQYGRNYPSINTFYPAPGFRVASSGAFSNVGTGGYYWTSSIKDANVACDLDFMTTYVYSSYTTAVRSYGISIRCCKEY